MLNDDRLLPEMRQQLEEAKAAGDDDKPPRPGLPGYSREAAMLHQVATKIVELQRIVARNMSIPLPPGPLFPAERIEMEDKAEEVNDLWSTVFAAMKTTTTTGGDR